LFIGRNIADICFGEGYAHPSWAAGHVEANCDGVGCGIGAGEGLLGGTAGIDVLAILNSNVSGWTFSGSVIGTARADETIENGGASRIDNLSIWKSIVIVRKTGPGTAIGPGVAYRFGWRNIGLVSISSSQVKATSANLRSGIGSASTEQGGISIIDTLEVIFRAWRIFSLENGEAKQRTAREPRLMRFGSPVNKVPSMSFRAYTRSKAVGFSPHE
jgi:hypothetical protein